MDKHLTLARISKSNDRTIREELAKEDLDNDVKDYIAQYGTHEHRWKLLKEHKLDNYTVLKIARYGNKEIRQFVKKLLEQKS